MNLGYTIISVDESRADTKEDLRKQMWLPEVTDIEFVDARPEGVIDQTVEDNRLKITGNKFHCGELGVWFSQINCWKWLANSDLDGLIVLEDDAVVLPDAEYIFNAIVSLLPENWDFVVLRVPDDQLNDYYYNRTFFPDGGWRMNSLTRFTKTQSPHYLGNDLLATAYQGYSCVATLYSREGAKKLLDLVDEHGLYTPVDCFLFLENNKKALRGFAPLPQVAPMFTMLEHGTITRHTGMYN